jgi:hypothetical protein
MSWKATCREESQTNILSESTTFNMTDNPEKDYIDKNILQNRGKDLYEEW